MENCKNFTILNPVKEIPKHHSIQSRYSSYDRVNDYVRHITKVFDNALNRSAEYDSSCVESISFKSKLPQINGKFKNSSFPASHVSPEIREKIALLNAYNKLSDSRVSKPKFRAKSTVLPDEKAFKPRNEFLCFTGKLQRLCMKCNYSMVDCRCSIMSPFSKKVTEAESPLSAEIYASKKKPPFVIRSMNSSYSLSTKKPRNKLSFSFEETNLMLLPRYLNK